MTLHWHVHEAIYSYDQSEAERMAEVMARRYRAEGATVKELGPSRFEIKHPDGRARVLEPRPCEVKHT